MINEGNQLNDDIQVLLLNRLRVLTCSHSQEAMKKEDCNLEDFTSRHEEYQKKKHTLEQMVSKQQKLAHELYNALDVAINKYGSSYLLDRLIRSLM